MCVYIIFMIPSLVIGQISACLSSSNSDPEGYPVQKVRHSPRAEAGGERRGTQQAIIFSEGLQNLLKFFYSPSFWSLNFWYNCSLIFLLCQSYQESPSFIPLLENILSVYLCNSSLVISSICKSLCTAIIWSKWTMLQSWPYFFLLYFYLFLQFLYLGLLFFIDCCNVWDLLSLHIRFECIPDNIYQGRPYIIFPIFHYNRCHLFRYFRV